MIIIQVTLYTIYYRDGRYCYFDIRLLQNKNITIIKIIASTVKIPIKVSNYIYINVSATDHDISADNHDITRLLLLTIIDSGKNALYQLLTNKILWQNRLIVHP